MMESRIKRKYRTDEW